MYAKRFNFNAIKTSMADKECVWAGGRGEWGRRLDQLQQPAAFNQTRQAAETAAVAKAEDGQVSGQA